MSTELPRRRGILAPIKGVEGVHEVGDHCVTEKAAVEGEGTGPLSGRGIATDVTGGNEAVRKQHHGTTISVHAFAGVGGLDRERVLIAIA